MKKLTGNLFKMGLLALLTILTSMQTQAAALSYTVLDSSLIRVSTPTNLVIRKRTDWQNFYIAATSHIFPQPTIPTVDFSKVTVVVVRGVAIFAKACFEDVLSKQAAKT